MPGRRLLVVHAHPDDECISTGGTLARYAAEDAAVTLVTCTNGEVGEIAALPEFGPDPESLRPRLAEIRAGELREACRLLGVTDVRMLGYHDSGMDGMPENGAPHAFVNQPFQEVVSRLVTVVREVRPQVAVTYNEYGFYGHPDHIRAHHATVAALDAASDATRYADAGPAWTVPKLYHTAVPKSRLRMAREIFEEERFDPDEVERIGTDDERITTALDVGAYSKQKLLALEAHRTQRDTTAWFLGMPEEVRDLVLGTEYYVLASPAHRRPNGPHESDLFEGVA